METSELLFSIYFASGFFFVMDAKNFSGGLIRIALIFAGFFIINVLIILYKTYVTDYGLINENVNFKLPFKTIKNLINSLYNIDNLISCDETKLRIKAENKIYYIGFKNRFDYYRYIKFVTKLENEEENAKMAQEKQEKERKSIESLKNFSDSLIREYSSYDFSNERNNEKKNELMVIKENIGKSKGK